MAPRITPATTPETPAGIIDPGTFISTNPVGFVSPTPAAIARINRLMLDLPQTDADRQFFVNLLTIKLLAPEESKELFIYPSAMVVDFVTRLKSALTMRFYNGR